MISGAHFIIYSTNPKKDRDFFRNILKLTNVDAGDGWLIFGLPPSEVAIHPSSENNLHEFYLLCDDIKKFIREITKNDIVCSAIQNQGWGLLTRLSLPGGGRLGVYQPRHARPKPMTIKIETKKIDSSKSKKVVTKKLKPNPKK
jgi:hypothetical protein